MRRTSAGLVTESASFLVLILFIGSSMLSAVGTDGSAAAWTGPESNYPLNWSYSDQTVINQKTVAQLQVKWTFPVPAAPQGLAQGAEGIMVTPLIYDGIVYGITNWHRLYALNAANGKIVWYDDLPLMTNYSAYLQPSVPGPLGVPLGHYHSLILTTEIRGEALVWAVSNTYQVFAVNALTGDIVINFNPLISDRRAGIQGNYGLYDEDTPSILVDQQRGVVILSPSATEGDSAGRGFLEGWDVNTPVPKFLWRTFVIPPQDGSDQSWSLDSVENMSHAYIFDGTKALDLKSLDPGQLADMLQGDWGDFGFNGTNSFAGASAAWGGAWAIEEQAGMAYVGTNVPGPDWNATYRPGPDLWTASVLALNVSSGRVVWGFQAIPHALGDFDCSWNVALANETIAGRLTPVVFKGCKNGYIFALDGFSGKMLWYLRPPSINYENVVSLDPTNSTQMRHYNWDGFPTRGPIVQNPADTGALESDIAFDPGRNMIFAATYNDPKQFQYTDVGPRAHENATQWEFSWGVDILNILPVGEVNTTVYGIDARTGAVKWTYDIPDTAYRGGLTVSGGVVYVATLDGTLRMLDADNGNLLSSRSIGGSLLVQPSIGIDVNGNMTLVLTDMGSSRWGPPFPGFVQAFGLPSLSSGSTPPASRFDLLYAVGLIAVASAVIILLPLRGRWEGKKRLVRSHVGAILRFVIFY